MAAFNFIIPVVRIILARNDDHCLFSRASVHGEDENSVLCHERGIGLHADNSLYYQECNGHQ